MIYADTDRAKHRLSPAIPVFLLNACVRKKEPTGRKY
jgi:hypothetical protein